jgi:hypothetical protein
MLLAPGALVSEATPQVLLSRPPTEMMPKPLVDRELQPSDAGCVDRHSGIHLIGLEN